MSSLPNPSRGAIRRKLTTPNCCASDLNLGIIRGVAIVIGLRIIDVVVVVVYLLGITVLGTWMGRSVKGLSDYFMTRRFGKGMMMMIHAFGTA